MVRLCDGEAFKHLSFPSIPHTGFAASYDVVRSLDVAASYDAAHEPDSAAYYDADASASYDAAAHEPANNHAPLRGWWWRRRLLKAGRCCGTGSKAMDLLRGPGLGSCPALTDIASHQHLDAFRGEAQLSPADS
jgi:hypothetical protein